ncbi:AMP-dependent synthetase and ligase [Natrinema pellirubrum DSM 15624]|uniref:AMP-dependent synthetase and ligase n=1 Tax=Natrinema pellirubrum (strain DSM 15624 / CIP 106293 / JCM 10476 / NCIMB 786 / 157) TaxID=797303 RepID=L0JG36_NATP1|nr:long-chain-fatty-acid--CoA ligase [Natrinema pellirubrum]AGB30269.1 acyl-CoA synthetase (AMP-forming)/AMP-acid ligase II [Natrinema pellirubrum DSM 15624]ELY79058.1 AMP-dependent synthetase and ligase [Natrinema pellirubrum DSM 15624]
METPLIVTDFLEQARSHYGDEEAIVGADGERFTYAEFGDRVDRFAAALQARGIEKGDRVAVLDPNTHYHLEAAHGAMGIGAVHTPLNYRLEPDDYEYILSDAGVDAIYADYEYAEKIEAIRDDVPTETFITNDADAVEGDWESFDAVLEDTDPEYDRPEMAEDEVITINYTSGTTGDPKGVCRTHRTETIHAYLMSIYHEITDDDTYLWTLPMFHVNGWGHIYAVTGMGATHVCTRGVNADDVVSSIRDEDVSLLCAAPAVLNQLIDYYETEGEPEMTGANPVRVTTAGSAPPEATIRAVEDRFGWYLKHLYGATETGPLITISDAKRLIDDGNRFEIKKRQGMGVLGTDVRVVDEDGNDVPRDDQTLGEVVVRGNQIMDRYWNKPEATEEAFNDRVEGYYHTGDLATIDENGMIALRDRKKDIIISGGENISSIELEDTLFDHEAVADAAVIPAPSDEWGETPKAFVVPSNGDPTDPPVSAEELTDFTREQLAGYKVVRRVEYVKELPKTATGKTQKYELRQQEWADEDRMIGEG